MLIGSAFGQLPAKWAPPIPPVGHMGAPGMHVIPMPVPQPTAVFGLPGILRSDRDFIPAYVANYVLGGGGFSSRLMQEVREKRGLTYGISSSLDTLRKAGIFAVQVATRANAMQQTIDVVRATMKDFADNGATDKELADAKTYITGSFPLAFSSNSRYRHPAEFVSACGSADRLHREAQRADQRGDAGRREAGGEAPVQSKQDDNS